MKKLTMLSIAAALLTAIIPGNGAAFRCGDGLAIVGDKTGKVLIECGPPTAKESAGARAGGKIVKKTERPKKKEKSATPAVRREASPKVERWFYNCGEHDFVYVLTFEGGVLAKEETEGYGKGSSDCLGKGRRR
ncbi:MAG: DUF2845 domain-containing protein [Deltaproteobacteria bacterium]|nr:DUF2845 domain-containing protein [Deltaproteobacteria bacterium]